MLLLTAPACDFDIPEKFEMPTWFLDIKIPLVQKRYEMGDLSNPDYNIYPTPDSMGFQIVYEAEFPFTSLDPENLKIDFPGGYIETVIPVSEIPGIPLSSVPSIDPVVIKPVETGTYITEGERINLVDHSGGLQYVDTTLVINPYTGDTLCFPYPSGVTYCGTLFTFPITEKKVISAEFYNDFIAGNINLVLEEFFNAANSIEIPPLPFDDIASNADLISSVDTLNIADGDESKYSTWIKNKGIPTDITGVYSRLVTGTEAYDDTLANHTSSGIANGEVLNEIKDLYGEGLAQLIQISNMIQVGYATPGTFITLYPEGNAEGQTPSDSMYLDFEIGFGIAGIEGIDISIDSVGLEIPKPEIPFGATENDDGTTTSLELYRTVLETEGVPYNTNRLQVLNLTNTMPFKLNFLMDYKNFFAPAGNEPVKIDQILVPGETYDYNISLKGDTMRASHPDSAIDKLDLDLAVSIPTQKVTLPLDGSSLGGLGLTIRFGSLAFKELEANIVQGFPSVPQDQEMPQGFKGATIADVRLALIMKSQIKLPVRMNMDFTGVDVFGDTTKMNFAIDTIGYPPTDLDTSMTVIELNRYGTQIQIYDRTTDSIPSYDTIVAPAEGQGTIIDLMASNPTKLTIDAAARIDGRGTIVAGAGLGGGFRLVAPFSLILDEMVFLSQPTVIEEMEYETRNKIRNSLISAEMVFDVMNAMPIGAELSMLLSNSEYFPTSGTPEMLLAFRDTMAIKQGWSPTDNVYILSRCSDLSPKTSNIYIYDVMTDFNECIDGIPYIIRSDGSGVDTVISYVDTLFKFILPDPNRLYSSEDTLGFPEGMVAEPGNASYATGLDTNRVRLITDYGDHYVMPRFQINSTDSQMIFLSVNDHLEVGSFITFRVSSSGIFASANSELVIVKPNGGQTLYTDQSYDIQWRTYGEGISEVNLYYSTSSDTNISAAIDGYWAGASGGIIAENVSSVAGFNTYEWDLAGISEQDSLRILIVSKENVVLDPKTEEYVKARDMNGWYLKVRNPGRTSSISSVDQDFIGPHSSRLNWNQ